uniref:Uncharacterized protein n=1 Tax=Anguilla anguilla TaxID=7936 RepID=A0A0E9SD31_ANGAN
MLLWQLCSWLRHTMFKPSSFERILT